jgi:hypothetical protein
VGRDDVAAHRIFRLLLERREEALSDGAIEVVPLRIPWAVRSWLRQSGLAGDLPDEAAQPRDRRGLH